MNLIQISFKALYQSMLCHNGRISSWLMRLWQCCCCLQIQETFRVGTSRELPIMPGCSNCWWLQISLSVCLLRACLSWRLIHLAATSSNVNSSLISFVMPVRPSPKTPNTKYLFAPGMYIIRPCHIKGHMIGEKICRANLAPQNQIFRRETWERACWLRSLVYKISRWSTWCEGGCLWNSLGFLKSSSLLQPSLPFRVLHACKF